MSDLYYAILLLILGIWFLITGIFNFKRFLPASIDHPTAKYPKWLKRGMAVLVGLFLVAISIKLLLH